MSILFLVLILLFNFVVSIWNAHVAGRVWLDAKALGGWSSILAWSAAVQSACGFATVYVVALGAGLVGIGLIHAPALHALMALTYLLIILPVLGTGLIITVESWIAAFRERSYANMTMAALNTATTAYNMASALDGGISNSVSSLSNFFANDDDDEALYIELAALVGFSLAIGTTAAIMRRSMRALPHPAIVAARGLPGWVHD